MHAPRRARPTDPNTARVCPQCGELTWRLTRHCGLWVGYTQRDWLWQAVGTLLLVFALRVWGDWLQR